MVMYVHARKLTSITCYVRAGRTEIRHMQAAQMYPSLGASDGPPKTLAKHDLHIRESQIVHTRTDVASA